MLSKEDQRRFDQIARHLRTTDPEFVARVGDRSWTRRNHLLVLFSILLWAAVPPLAVVGGWIAAAVSMAALGGAAALLVMVHRRSWRR